MRKGLFFAAFAALYFCPYALNSAQAHALTATDDTAKPFAADILNKKKPVMFYYENCGHPYAEKIKESFAAWFENAQKYIRQDEQKNLFKEYKEILKFGAGTKAYVCTESADNADIFFFFDENAPRTSQGVFKHHNNAMIIAVRKSEMEDRRLQSLTHEIGHSLRAEDLYDGEFSAAEYGSGIKDSIMNKAKQLTCDDADALINALYISKKIAGENPKDLQFDSFCNKTQKTKITYKNARQLNRKPMIVDFRGKRTVYTYCKDGGIRSITQVAPADLKNIYKVLKEPADCDFIPLLEKQEPFNKKGNFVLKDFIDGEILESSLQNDSAEKNIFLSLPNSLMTINITINGQHAPAVLRVLNEKNRPVYILAYLEDEFNFVYDDYFSGNSGEFITAFVYDRGFPKDNFVFERRINRPACSTKNAELCKKMENILKKQLSYFGKQTGFRGPADGGFNGYTKARHLTNARLWENFILNSYPPDNIIKKRLKADLTINAETTRKNTKNFSF